VGIGPAVELESVEFELLPEKNGLLIFSRKWI
jgi:hypothetical protein